MCDNNYRLNIAMVLVLVSEKVFYIQYQKKEDIIVGVSFEKKKKYLN